MGLGVAQAERSDGVTDWKNVVVGLAVLGGASILCYFGKVSDQLVSAVYGAAVMFVFHHATTPHP